jgi:hypothetical protein
MVQMSGHTDPSLKCSSYSPQREDSVYEEEKTTQTYRFEKEFSLSLSLLFLRVCLFSTSQSRATLKARDNENSME